MRKVLLAAVGLFLLFNSCKKKNKDLLNWPDPIYKLDYISTVTLSGAMVRYDFIYTGPLLTAVNYVHVGMNEQIFHHEFIYNGDKLARINTYRPSGGTSVLERRLIVYYSDSRVNKIEQYFCTNGIPFLSSFIDYSYDLNGKMIQKISTNQLSWGPQVLGKSDYAYDAAGNITRIKEEYPNSGSAGISFYPSYSNRQNTIRINNPPLSAFIWYLIDANFFKDGFEEVFLFSKNVVSGTKKEINGLTYDYSFNMEFDINNNITRILNYPKLYSSSYYTDPVFYDMKLHYVLHSQ